MYKHLARLGAELATETTRLRFVRTAAPLYRDVAEALERALRERLWKPGEQIPTEAELEKRFGASRGTLRMAISELVRKGMLFRQPGRGTFVLGPEFRTLERYFQIERLDSREPIVPVPKTLERRTVRADARAAAGLRIEVGEEVGYVRRLRLHEDEPFQIVDSYFRMDFWRQIERADFDIHAVYDQFKDDFGIYIVHADEFLRADLATKAEARLLKIAPGVPVLRLERLAYSFGEQPVEYRRSVGRSDHFHYHVRLR
jgi:GntR family transcriptional regulator